MQKASNPVPSAERKMNPTISLDEDDFPAIKNAKVGKKFKLYVTAKVVGVNQDTCCGDGKSLRGTLEILSINDEDFKNKSYSDIVDEDMETEGDD